MLSVAQTKGVVIAASVAFHVWIAAGVIAIKTPKPRRAPTAITMQASKRKPAEKKVEPEPQKIVEPTPEAPKRAPAKPAPTTAPKVAEAAPPPGPTSNGGGATEIAGNFGNGGTLAIPMPGNVAPSGPSPKASVDKPAGPKIKALAAIPIDECADPPAKPKPIKVLQPAYTDDARAAAIEGRVRVEITVDETGAVVSTRVLAGLGHGLDESALAAAKGSTFSAAVRCGKPVRSTFTIGMRFSL